MSAQSTISKEPEIGLILLLNYKGDWNYRATAVNTDVSPLETNNRILAQAAFKMSSKTMEKFLSEEEGSIF